MEAIEGAKETIEKLRAMGKRLYFVSNNSTKSREQYSEKFKRFGITVDKNELFPASFASVAYLKAIGFHNRTDRNKVYVVGKQGILLELEEAGIPWVWCEDVVPRSSSTSM